MNSAKLDLEIPVTDVFSVREQMIGNTKSVFEKPKEKVMEEPKCPRCKHPTDRMLTTGAPGICNRCRNEAVSQAMRSRVEKRPVVPKKKCVVAECTADHFARGFCQPHYDKWKRGNLPGDWPAFRTVKKPAKAKQNIPENIPVSSTVSLSKNPTPTQILDALQGELEGHLSEARQIHMDMLTVKRLFGVEYEIKALSLVG